MRWRSQAYATHDEGMLFEKTTRHRPKAVAGAEVYFVRNLQIRRLIFAAAYMNGRFSRCAAARIFSLTRHFHRCERTQRKIRIHTLGSKPPLAAQSMKVRCGPIVTDAAACTFLHEGRIADLRCKCEVGVGQQREPTFTLPRNSVFLYRRKAAWSPECPMLQHGAMSA